MVPLYEYMAAVNFCPSVRLELLASVSDRRSNRDVPVERRHDGFGDQSQRTGRGVDQPNAALRQLAGRVSTIRTSGESDGRRSTSPHFSRSGSIETRLVALQSCGLAANFQSIKNIPWSVFFQIKRNRTRRERARERIQRDSFINQFASNERTNRRFSDASYSIQSCVVVVSRFSLSLSDVYLVDESPRSVESTRCEREMA